MHKNLEIRNIGLKKVYINFIARQFVYRLIPKQHEQTAPWEKLCDCSKKGFGITYKKRRKAIFLSNILIVGKLQDMLTP